MITTLNDFLNEKVKYDESTDSKILYELLLKNFHKSGIVYVDRPSDPLLETIDISI